MIIYLASYPRSGNSWLQRIFSHYFGLSTATYYAKEATKDDNDPSGFFIMDGGYKKLVNNCGKFLTPEFRKKIALEENPYLIKTHELPFSEYYKGELVIYLLRHPGAVVWSYFNFKHDFHSADDSMERIIIGDSFVGSWSEHVRHWQVFGKTHKNIYHEIKYEDINLTAGFLKNLQDICKVRIKDTDQALPDFNVWHERAPKMFRSGKENDWATQLTIDQLLLVWLVNNKQMTINGYDMKMIDQNFEGQVADLLKDHSSEIFKIIHRLINQRNRV